MITRMCVRKVLGVGKHNPVFRPQRNDPVKRGCRVLNVDSVPVTRVESFLRGLYAFRTRADDGSAIDPSLLITEAFRLISCRTRQFLHCTVFLSISRERIKYVARVSTKTPRWKVHRSTRKMCLRILARIGRSMDSHLLLLSRKTKK